MATKTIKSKAKVPAKTPASSKASAAKRKPTKKPVLLSNTSNSEGKLLRQLVIGWLVLIVIFVFVVVKVYVTG